MIKFNSVSMRYADGFEALKSVSFDLADGEMVFLTGHSGAGKSTLLKLITISERPASGEILFRGLNLGRVLAKNIYNPKQKYCKGKFVSHHTKCFYQKNYFFNLCFIA